MALQLKSETTPRDVILDIPSIPCHLSFMCLFDLDVSLQKVTGVTDFYNQIDQNEILST